MTHQAELIAQADALTRMGEKVLATESGSGPAKVQVKERQFHDFRISALSYLSRVFGADSIYYQNLKSEVTQPTPSRTRRGLAIIDAARRDLENDWLQTTTGTITRDVLVDTLRIARLEADQGHNQAAVILAGGLLEKLLRHLGQANGLALHNQIQNRAEPKRGLQLTGELYKKKALSRQENRSVMGWLELARMAAQDPGTTIDREVTGKLLMEMHSFFAKIKM